MISHVTKSVLRLSRQSFASSNALPGMLKLTHSFSDKNPFDKFKRKANPKKQSDSTSKKQKEPEAVNSNEGQQKKQQGSSVNKSTKDETKNAQDASEQIDRQGFSKFRRTVHARKQQKKGDLDANNLSEKTQPSQSTMDSKRQDNSQASQENNQTLKSKSESSQTKASNTKDNTSQKAQHNDKTVIKGFEKFKASKKSDKDNIPKQPKENVDKQKSEESDVQEKDKDEQSHILNQKKSQQQEGVSKDELNRRTEQKKQEQQEEWQKFYQEQIKKTKDDLNESVFNKKFKRIQQMSFMNKNQDQSPKPPKDPNNLMKNLILAGGALFLLSQIYKLIFDNNYQSINSSELVQKLHAGEVAETWFQKNVLKVGDENQKTTTKYIYVKLTNGDIFRCESNNDFQVEWNKLVDSHNLNMSILGGNLVLQKPPVIETDSHLYNTVRSILSYVLLFMFIQSIRKGAGAQAGRQGGKGGMSGAFGDSKSQRFRLPVNTKFTDVVGMNKAKEQIVQFIDFLKKPEKYSALGAKIPRGALLTGPPGTGKTMLAKACAGQSGVPFFTISGSEFVEMYVGVGAQRVRSLFKEAKQASPSIIFIDEIDAVGKKRSSGSGGGGNDERDNTLNQLLVQMDGFDKSSNVIVFAATNQKKVLDPALTRPGRFDRLIEVDLPDIEGRKQIFHVHLKPLTLDPKFQIEDYARRLATLTPGFSGADIKNLCNQAAIIAARGQKTSVSVIDFQMASERIIGGVEKKSSLITPQTKRTVAYHECGHGVVSWFMEHASPLLKLTIIPRSKGALGYAQYLPNQNQMYTLQQLEDQICVILGGRISQEIFFNKISTGASDDLQKAQAVCKEIIAKHGMGSDLGWLGFTETQYAKEYSRETEERIDAEMSKLIQKCSIKTRQIINDKKELIKELAQVLLKQETIDQRIIQRVLGQRPFKSSQQYEDYIRERKQIDQEYTPVEPKVLTLKQSSKLNILQEQG